MQQASLQAAAQLAAPPKFEVTKCSKERYEIVKVLRPTGIYYAYEYCHKKRNLIPHACSCQPTVTEASLQPLYSIDSVIFMFNTVTQKVEKYEYNFETDAFEQLENTGLVYNSALVTQSYLITTVNGPSNVQVLIERDHVGSLRKHAVNGKEVLPMTPSRVITLMSKTIEKREQVYNNVMKTYDDEDHGYWDYDTDDSYSDEEERERDAYIDALVPLLLAPCPHDPHGVIVAFNYNKERYESFTYCDVNAKFINSECACRFDIRENDLIPKYVEQAKDKKFVIHVHNVFTNLIEQYVYDVDGFKQVYYKELIYNPDKTTNATIVTLVGGALGTIALMRDSNGRFKKEQFSIEQTNYIPLVALPVKTFLVQREEAAKKMRAEMKAKSRAAFSTMEPEVAPAIKTHTVHRAPEPKDAPSKAADDSVIVLEQEDGSKKSDTVVEPEVRKDRTVPRASEKVKPTSVQEEQEALFLSLMEKVQDTPDWATFTTPIPEENADDHLLVRKKSDKEDQFEKDLLHLQKEFEMAYPLPTPRVAKKPVPLTLEDLLKENEHVLEKQKPIGVASEQARPAPIRVASRAEQARSANGPMNMPARVAEPTPQTLRQVVLPKHPYDEYMDLMFGGTKPN